MRQLSFSEVNYRQWLQDFKDLPRGLEVLSIGSELLEERIRALNRDESSIWRAGSSCSTRRVSGDLE